MSSDSLGLPSISQPSEDSAGGATQSPPPPVPPLPPPPPPQPPLPLLLPPPPDPAVPTSTPAAQPMLALSAQARNSSRLPRPEWQPAPYPSFARCGKADSRGLPQRRS
eukprot:4754351-Pleurochrysis_carterae.AAC.1